MNNRVDEQIFQESILERILISLPCTCLWSGITVVGTNTTHFYFKDPKGIKSSMKYFKKLKSKTESDEEKRYNSIIRKFGIKDIALNKDEMDILNIISHLVAIPLFENQEDINKNTVIRFHTFFYILGLIDGFCQFFKISNSSFYKICLHFFLNDAYPFNQFALTFLERYNEITKYDFIFEIMKLGGEDALSEWNSIAKNEKRLIPQIRISTLISEWEKLTYDVASEEQKKFLTFLNNQL